MGIKAKGADIFTVDAMTAANEIHRLAKECTKIARDRWKKVAYQYALFNKCLNESGLVDWQVGSTLHSPPPLGEAK
jgi:hypothetical protein